MKRDESSLLSPARIEEARGLDEKLARLRMARGPRQADAAACAGLARCTSALIEKGDLSRTLAQILRYLEAIAPRVTVLALLPRRCPVAAGTQRTRTHTARAAARQGRAT